MRNLVLITLAVACLSLVWAEETDIRAVQLASKAAQHLNGICTETLTKLQITASTPEAQNGDWKKIKPDLAELNAVTPGVYFYVQPDGNYYSVEKDFTNLNLRDRDYFLPLMYGNIIKGSPVYSRSTGKKSVVFAAPISTNGKVTGALGASVYLDELRIRMNDYLALPENTTWFVIDALGNTVLDKDPDFIFMNVLTQGTESLKEAMQTVLVGETGSINYEIGGTYRYAQYKKLASMDWWVVTAYKQGTLTKASPKLEMTLKHFTPELQKKLSNIDKFSRKFIAGKKSNWENEAAIRKSLDSIVAEFPDVVEATLVDVKGVLRYIEPKEYKNFEGVDISAQDHVIALRKNLKPVFSSGFMSVEGFLAVDLAYPVYNKKGDFLGSISLLINPAILVKPILKEISFAAGYEPWFMQTDGMIVYDPDTEEVGKMLFTDPIYKDYTSLLELGKTISANRKGSGEYVFQAMGHQEKVVKSCSWDTVSLYGREWRVVLAHKEK